MRKIASVLSCLAVISLICCAALVPSWAQTASQLNTADDPVINQVVRALQQRSGTEQTLPPAVQPEVRTQALPAYTPNNSAASNLPRSNDHVAPSAVSSLERLMSRRAGQRLRQFGYDVFGGGSPVLARQTGALQDSYILGTGDEIVVTLRGQQNAAYRTRVDRDGRVVLPGLPPLPAAGRRFGDFRDDFQAAVTRAFAGTAALVSVGSVRQISVNVVGEVVTPGAYSLTGLSTAMDALNLAGGINKSGSLRGVQLVRGGKANRLDLYALLTGASSSADLTLTEGDRLVVPLQSGAVAVAGQVKRSAIYELPPHQTSISVSALLALAGGPEVRGAYRLSVLRTRADGRREMVRLDESASTAIRDGEILFVHSTADVSLGKVDLVGAGALDGYYAIGEAQSLRGLLKSADMFTPAPGKPLPYMLLGGVIRLNSLTMQRIVVPFSPADILGGRTDVPLQSNDVVYILNVAEMRYIADRASRTAQENSDRIIDERTGRILSGGENVAAQIGQLQTSPLGHSATVQSHANGNIAQGNSLVPPDAATGASQFAPGGRLEIPGTSDPQMMGNTVSGPPGILPPPEGMPSRPDTSDTDRSQLESALLNPGIIPRASFAQPDVGDLANSNLQNVQTIFVGIDADARQLLVSTLGNYYVTVAGEVNRPGDFLMMPGTTLDRVVEAAGGVTPKVDLHAFEITSAKIDNVSGVSQTVRRSYSLAASEFARLALQPFDRIRFNAVYSDRDSGEVSLFGQIRYPGAYEILRGEHLSSLLARAGGFTQAAYPAGAIFLRRSVAEQERGVLQREADTLERQLAVLVGSHATREKISDSEINYVNQLVQRLRQTGIQGGRIAVQIDPREVASHPELDVVLEPGDQLFIPRRPSSVIVAGEVMSAGGIQYRAGQSVADYVAMAGGTTQIADDDHIFVIQPDGSAVQVSRGWFTSNVVTLAPGSVIVVPRTLNYFTWDALLTSVTQVTSQLAITAASIAVIFR